MFFLCFLISICLFSYFIFVKLTFNIFAFSLIFFIISLIFLKSPRTIYKDIKIFIVFLICLVSILILSMLFHCNERYEGKSDCIVVLGAGLKKDKPSLTLMARLDIVVSLNKINPDTKIIVSGGQGEDEIVSEAFAMKKYLVDHGIDENLIIIEDKSISTKENIEFSSKIINEKKLGKNVTIVSSDFHILRGKFLSVHYGLNPHGYGCKTLSHLVFAYFSREAISLIKDIVLSPSYR